MKIPILSILITLFLLSCSTKAQQEKQVAESFPVTSPIKIDTTLHTDYVAEINAVQNVEIRARVKGYLDKVFIDEGKNVKQGQVLFSINNPELKEQAIKAGAILR
ncbi:biotin/lipoyl-binding protein, partial [Arcicella sp. LKC2W]|uniref:biotin/lipoyl-binding protein n=1 Tax=Arcicella sp. LKC2W TaxID=2984198 RepID=UPI002B216AD4